MGSRIRKNSGNSAQSPEVWRPRLQQLRDVAIVHRLLSNESSVSASLSPCLPVSLTMILTGSEIQRRLGNDIAIEPFRKAQLNANSYNVRLHDELLVYEEVVLDMQRPNRYRRYTIPPEGLVLSPNQLYLGRTVERTQTHNLVPMLEGRSSIGRLGLFVHVTAGFGDVGFDGYWTLEMFAIHPVRIYPGVEIAQLFYHTIEGEVTEYKSDKYQHNDDIQPSLLFKEFREEPDPQMRLAFGKQETPE